MSEESDAERVESDGCHVTRVCGWRRVARSVLSRKPGDGEYATVGDMQVRVGDVRLQGDVAPTKKIFNRGEGQAEM